MPVPDSESDTDSSPAQKKNSVPPNTPHASFLHLDEVGEHKWKWVKAAQRAGMRLSDWVIATLNAAAAKILNPPEK